MIKRFILYIVISLFFGPLFGQDESSKSSKQRKFLLGMTFGLNIANIDAKGDDSLDFNNFKSKAGLYFGPSFYYNFSPYLQLKTGFAFSNKGYKLKDTIFPNSPNEVLLRSNQVLHYLSVPFVFKGTFIEKVNGTLYLEAGGYWNYLVSGFSNTKILNKNEIKNNINIEDDDFKIGNSDDDNFTPHDVSLLLGLGLDFYRLDIGFSYEIGLSDIAPDNLVSAQNRILRFSLIIKAI